MAAKLAERLPEVLASVRTRPLFIMRLDVLPYQIIGGSDGAFRRVGIVPGGIFEGERLSGKVLPGGNDWQTVRSDGSIVLDVKLVLETTDGALIGMTYKGIRRGPPEVIARLDKGENVDPAAYYFRTNPMFETASSYSWINSILAIGAGYRTPDGVIYSLFEVL